MFATWRLRQRSAVGGMGLNGHITPRKTLTPHVRFGSKREAAYFGLMSASASFGHNAAQTYGRVMPQERTNALRNRIATRSVSGNNPGSQAFPGGAITSHEQTQQMTCANAPLFDNPHPIPRDVASGFTTPCALVAAKSPTLARAARRSAD